MVGWTSLFHTMSTFISTTWRSSDPQIPASTWAFRFSADRADLRDLPTAYITTTETELSLIFQRNPALVIQSAATGSQQSGRTSTTTANWICLSPMTVSQTTSTKAMAQGSS